MANDKPISFNPEYRIGDLVSPVVDPGITMMVIGYEIAEVDEDGYVAFFSYITRGMAGYLNFEPREIKESIGNHK